MQSFHNTFTTSILRPENPSHRTAKSPLEIVQNERKISLRVDDPLVLEQMKAYQILAIVAAMVMSMTGSAFAAEKEVTYKVLMTGVT